MSSEVAERLFALSQEMRSLGIEEDARIEAPILELQHQLMLIMEEPHD
jgi:hypothetical protein